MPGIAKALLSLSVTFMCTAVGVLAIVATRDMEAARTQAAGVAAKFNEVLSQTSATLKAINDPGSGMLAKLNADIDQGKLVIAHADAIVTEVTDPKHGTLHWVNKDAVDAHDLLVHVDQTADAMRKASAGELESTQKTIEAVKPMLAQATATLEDLGEDAQQLQNLEVDANEIIADPSIPVVIANLTTMSDNAADISTAGRQVVDKYAHPSKKHLGFWGGLWAAAQVVHKLSPPLF